MKSGAAQHVKSRLTWGVMLRTGTGSKGHKFEWTGPLFTAWWADLTFTQSYAGEVSRALLFHTRTHARAFCDLRNAGRSCKDWHFYPVRIRETLEVK